MKKTEIVEESDINKQVDLDVVINQSINALNQRKDIKEELDKNKKCKYTTKTKNYKAEIIIKEEK